MWISHNSLADSYEFVSFFGVHPLRPGYYFYQQVKCYFNGFPHQTFGFRFLLIWKSPRPLWNSTQTLLTAFFNQNITFFAVKFYPNNTKSLRNHWYQPKNGVNPIEVWFWLIYIYCVFTLLQLSAKDLWKVPSNNMKCFLVIQKKTQPQWNFIRTLLRNAWPLVFLCLLCLYVVRFCAKQAS